MGFAGVVIPEEDGGSGLGAVEAGVIAESLGRTLTPLALHGFVGVGRHRAEGGGFRRAEGLAGQDRGGRGHPQPCRG